MKKWFDKRGNEVHEQNVRVSDKIKDEMVREIFELMRNAQEVANDARKKAKEKIDSYLGLMEQEYNVKHSSLKGNMTFETFDGLLKVSIAVSDRIEFDEKMVFAKTKIDEFLKLEVEHVSPDMKTLINRFFEVDKKGNINVRKVLELKRLEIKSPLWVEAMKIIDDSISVSGSNAYLRFHSKSGYESPYEQLIVDDSKMQ